MRTWHTELLGQFLVDGLNANSQIGPMDFAVLHELRADPLGDVDGNCKANALKSAAGRADGRVDADHFALEVHQRPATVAGVNRGIRLDELVVFRDSDGAARRADDAGGDGIFQAERLADSNNPIANTE